MKLDPRIKSVSDIFVPTDDAESVEQFIGQKGYFADEMGNFSDLAHCVYGELISMDPDMVPDRPYACEPNPDREIDWYAFYIPESSLKPVKKSRHYTPEEFCDKFQVGQPVKFRKKDDEESEQDLVLQGLWYKRRDGKTIAYARLGSHLYALDELFNDFEWRALFKKDFEPFGVEE